MFREMRRKDRELSVEEANEIINNGKYGVLSLIGDEGYPYGVPLHYAVIGGKACFHSAADGGHKTESFANNPKASFTVIESEDGIKAKSAIIFGTIEVVPDLRGPILEKLVEKFVPPFAWEQAKGGIPYAQHGIIAYRLNTEHLTAKFVDKPEGQ